MNLKVGQLISSQRSINNCLFERLNNLYENIINSGEIIGLDYEKIYDERFKVKEWKSLLQREFLLLYHWLLKRIMLNTCSSDSNKLTTIYCFQPYYGVVLHYIRRVLPFLLLSYKVRLILNNKTAGEKLVFLLNSFLDITNVNIINKDSISNKDDSENNLFLITGRESTYKYLKKNFPSSTVIGATGKYGLLILQSPTTMSSHARNFYTIKPSCTNIKRTYIIDNNNRLIDSENLASAAREVLNKLNPTVIYSDIDLSKNSAFQFYKTINLNSAIQEPLIGLCADPLHGYPGDYLI